MKLFKKSKIESMDGKPLRGAIWKWSGHNFHPIEILTVRPGSLPCGREKILPQTLGSRTLGVGKTKREIQESHGEELCGSVNVRSAMRWGKRIRARLTMNWRGSLRWKGFKPLVLWQLNIDFFFEDFTYYSTIVSWSRSWRLPKERNKNAEPSLTLPRSLCPR